MRIHRPEAVAYIEANGLRFGYLEEGTGPLVVLVHGFPDTAHTWDVVRPALAAAGYRVVCPFTRGHAPTSIPDDGDYSSTALGTDVLALIEALGEDSAVVVGHDWGASAAYAAAALGPHLVRGLVTMAIPHPTSIRPSVSMVWGARHFLTLRLPGAVARHSKNDFDFVRALYERWSPGFDWPDSEFEAVKNAYAAPGVLDASFGYYRAIGLPEEALTRKIEVPSLLLGGRTDGVAGQADFERSGTRHTGPWRLEMLPGGHFLHREHPEPVIEALLGFLSQAG